MEIKEIVSSISSVGFGVVCSAFVLWLAHYMITKVVIVMDETQKTLVSIKDTLITLNSRVTKLEEKINQRGDE